MSMTLQKSEGKKLEWKITLQVQVITIWKLMKLIHPRGHIWPLWPLWVKTLTLGYWHYFLLLKWQSFDRFHPHFQEDFYTLKYVLFGYCVNKLWIFYVLIIASPKVWVCSTKTMILHYLQHLYFSGLLQYVFSTACLLFAYSRKWNTPGFRKTTLNKM
jgi:hypothetical protein